MHEYDSISLMLMISLVLLGIFNFYNVLISIPAFLGALGILARSSFGGTMAIIVAIIGLLLVGLQTYVQISQQPVLGPAHLFSAIINMLGFGFVLVLGFIERSRLKHHEEELLKQYTGEENEEE